MVPGSTLIYGSSFTMLILSPRASRIAPNEADAIPLPSEDTTPPVTNTNRVIGTAKLLNRVKKHAISTAKQEFEIRREFRIPECARPHNRQAAQSGACAATRRGFR